MKERLIIVKSHNAIGIKTPGTVALPVSDIMIIPSINGLTIQLEISLPSNQVKIIDADFDDGQVE